MASLAWFIFTVASLQACVVFCNVLPHLTYITPTSVHIQKSGNTRHVSVLYQASSEPHLRWLVNNNDMHDDPELNFINGFSASDGTGVARFTMPVGHVRQDPRLNITLIFKLPEFHLNVYLKGGSVLNRRNFQYDINPIYFDKGPDEFIDYIKGERLNFTMMLRSDDVNSFQLGEASGSITAIDYGIMPPERIVWSSWNRQNMDSFSQFNLEKPFFMSDEFEEFNETTRLLRSSINTSVSYISGRIRFEVKLQPVGRNRVLKAIEMERYLYLKEAGHATPYRENTVFLHSGYSIFSTYYDEQVSNHLPSMTFRATGYPKPEMTLTRQCADASDVTTLEMVAPKYETAVRFTFHNITSTHIQEYILAVKSGTFEIRDFISVRNSAI